MTSKRIRHDRTTPVNAAGYRRRTHDAVFPGIGAKILRGLQCIESPRMDLEDETELVTVTTFGALHHAIDLRGDDYRRCHLPGAAQKPLARRHRHRARYETPENREYR